MPLIHLIAWAKMAWEGGGFQGATIDRGLEVRVRVADRRRQGTLGIQGGARKPKPAQRSTSIKLWEAETCSSAQRQGRNQPGRGACARTRVLP